MIERLRVALFSYGAWLVVALFPFIACALFLIGCPEDRYLSLSDYFFCLSVLVVPLSIVIGITLKSQLGSWRSKLIPGWTAVHRSLGIGMCAVLAASGTAIVGYSLRGNLEFAAGEHMSVTGILGLICLEILLFVFVGYSKPLLLPFIPIAFMFAAYKGSALNPLLPILMKAGHPQIVGIVLVLEFVGGIVIVCRMLRTHEETPERQLPSFNYAEEQRRYWSSESPERGIRMRLMAYANRSLDSIPHPLGKDLRSQVRHFQLGILSGRLGWVMSIFLILTFWTLKSVTGFHHLGQMDQNFAMWTIFPAQAPFSQALFGQNDSRQWMFMLPLRRGEIVIRYLSAQFVSVLKMWLAYFVAIYVVAWMPFPGTFGVLPSLEPFLESFALLIPLFGILSLVLVRPRRDNAGTAVMLCAIVTTALAVLFVRAIHPVDLVPPFIIAAFITGVGLIWYSYRCWLQADLN